MITVGESRRNQGALKLKDNKLVRVKYSNEKRTKRVLKIGEHRVSAIIEWTYKAFSGTLTSLGAALKVVSLVRSR